MSAPEGWEGILAPGERILWQGRPDATIVWQVRNPMRVLFGLAFAGFALFWMIMAAQAGGFFWTFGLIHFAVGIGLATGGAFRAALVRRYSWYTLTNHRAFIATALPLRPRSLTAYPIEPETRLELTGDIPASIYFAEARRPRRSWAARIGFERIDEARDVFGMMQQVQRGQA